MTFRIAYNVRIDWVPGYERPHHEVCGVHPDLTFETEEEAEAAIKNLSDADDEEWLRWFEPRSQHIYHVYGDVDWDSAVSCEYTEWWPISADDADE